MDAIDPDELNGRLGREIETAHEPVGSLYLHHDPDLGHVEILYVAADPFPPADFWSRDGSRGRLLDGLGEVGPDVALALPLSLSDDGASIRLLPPETAPRQKVLVPPPALSRSCREGRTSFADLLLWGERQVAAYDAWRRGEVYGIVRETLSLSPGSSGLTDVHPSWEILDLEGATRVLAETVERREAELSPSAAPRP